MWVTVHDEEIEIRFAYESDRYEPAGMEALLKDCEKILHRVAADPTQPISDLLP
jgi:hypothetical protein